jgi:hypothetical protein
MMQARNRLPDDRAFGGRFGLIIFWTLRILPLKFMSHAETKKRVDD